MTEVKREFKVFKAFYICDSCKKGKMKFLYPLEGEGEELMKLIGELRSFTFKKEEKKQK